MDYIDGFLYIEPMLHSWDEAYLFVVNDCFDVFLDLVCDNFIEYFCIDINKGIYCSPLSCRPQTEAPDPDISAHSDRPRSHGEFR